MITDQRYGQICLFISFFHAYFYHETNSYWILTAVNIQLLTIIITFYKLFLLFLETVLGVLIFNFNFLIDLITVLEAILTGRQTCLAITVFVWKSDVK